MFYATDLSAAGPETPRVLFVSHTAHTGGAEKVLLRFLRRARGFSPVVVVPAGPLRDALRDAGVPVRRSLALGRLRKHRNPLWPLALTVRWLAAQVELLWHIVRARAQVVQANSFYALIYVMLPAWLSGRPLVWHMHDFVPAYGAEAWLLPLYRRAARHVIAVSEAVRADLVAHGVPAERVTTVYNVADAPEPYHDDALAERLRALRPAGGRLIAVVASLERRKGVAEVLRALELLRRDGRRQDVLVVAGTAHNAAQERYAAGLRRLIAQGGLEDCARLLGHVADVGTLLANVDALVHYPLRPDPLPTVILEALATGTPVVAADNGGNPECLQHGRWGRLVPPGDPAALAGVLSGALPEPLSETERAAAMEWFSHECKERAHRALYARLLG